MNGTIPRPLRLVLWILGGVLAVMAVFTLVSAWQSQSNGWWIGVCFFVSAGVCLTIAAVSGRSASGSTSG
jgi:predicted membrane channel-forming protein YqfA (hemolysin III family)